jgi:hypothetical protein
VRASGGEPPKKPVAADNNPFGDAPVEPAKPVLRPYGNAPAADGADPFGDAAAAVPDKPAKEVAPVPAKPVMPATKPKPQAVVKLHGGEKAIMKALKRTVSVEFKETPLKDVAEYLSDRYRIPIVLDAAGLKDAGIDESLPVTQKLSGISLQSALEIILDELQLKWTIHHDVLMITSPQKAESDEFMSTKIYDVTDLVLPEEDYTIGNNPLTAPGTGLEPMTPQSQPPMMMGYGMGAGMPTGGFSYAPRRGSVAANVAGRMGGGANFSPSPASVNIEPLKDAITNTIAPKSWMDNGGPGPISDLPPHFLVITQTGEVHRQIEQFLAELRARRRAVPTVHVELHWLWLDAAHREALLGSGAKGSPQDVLPAIDPRKFSEIAREVPSFHARATCLSGLITSLSAGDRRQLIVSGIPVVDDNVAYSPVISMPNVGVTAELRPTVIPGGNSAMLHVRSTITRWTPERAPANIGSAWPAGQRMSVDASQPAVNASSSGAPVMGVTPSGGTAPTPQLSQTTNVNAAPATSHASMSTHGPGSCSCPIDLPVMPTQEFGTTLRVPLGKPVIVGSVTFAPAGGAGLGEAKEKPVEVYLIATTSIVRKKP